MARCGSVRQPSQMLPRVSSSQIGHWIDEKYCEIVPYKRENTDWSKWLVGIVVRAHTHWAKRHIEPKGACSIECYRMIQNDLSLPTQTKLDIFWKVGGTGSRGKEHVTLSRSAVASSGSSALGHLLRWRDSTWPLSQKSTHRFLKV